MKHTLFTIAFLAGLSAASFAQQKTGFHLIQTHKIQSDGGWDYLTVDQKNNNLYVSHGNQVNILNKNTGDSTGVIHNTLGVHGIAIASSFQKGYTSNGRSGTCTVFDLTTSSILGQITVGQNPDATFFDDFSKKVIVFNGKSLDASIIDPQTDKVIATIPLGGKPEAGVSDGKGKIYVNIEDTGEIVCFDPITFKVLSRYKLKGGEEPSGLAIDRATSRLFTVCANKVMLILDAKTGRQVVTLPIGDGCDGVVFDPILKTAYSSNGEGNITVVKEESAEKFVVQETIATKSGARTIALDAVTHHLFLPTAEFEKATGTARPKRISGSFKILEIGK
ncbi:YncE family protein [Pedobacter sp. UC225_61]|uniref:YncE family protein n=1 Tax=Pedobacter sp. UC225_61 TaxID=3374623 RepID=UPI003793C25C